MNRTRTALLMMAVIVGGAPGANAQWHDINAFASGAVLVGAQGFARPPITTG